MQELKPKVLLGSPIRQKNEILSKFLSGLEELNKDSLLNVDYFFIDDNIEEVSSQLLRHFTEKNANTTLTRVHTQATNHYLCNENTHVWEEELIWKVADFKNHMIQKATNDGYDYLFLVDSDLILHPKTLAHLVSLNKDIVSEIFWTKWEPDFPELPQVWMFDQYNLYENSGGSALTPAEVIQKVQAFIKQLRVPGVYRVGGLGACTLISKKALLAGANYNKIYNISFVGEDRHFCIRAVALGFELFVDTHYPACHFYRLSDLEVLKRS